MKIIKFTVALSVIFGICSLGTASEKTVPKVIAPNVQIVSDKLQLSLKQKGLEYVDSTWPKDIDKIRVDRAKVPEDVMAKTSKWLRTMIRSKYLPHDLNNWLIAIRKPKPGYFVVKRELDGVHKVHVKDEGSIDYLIMRYEVGGHKLQVQEDGIAMSILIDPNNSIGENQEIEDFVTNIVREFLNYPQDKIGSLTFHLKNFKHNQKTIYYGTMDCDFDVHSKDAWDKRIWWNHTYIWTDGKRIYFSLVEMDGKPRKKTQAKPGIPPRFNKNQKS
jgi:hypothetical protein